MAPVDSDRRITLYTYALSPFGMKVYWALVYKRLPFNIVYVNPLDQREIAFSEQRTVPVLKIGEEWRRDSGPLCEWLESEFPSPTFDGAPPEERAAVREADRWVTENVIALNFKLAVDEQHRGIAFRNGRKLARIMRRTSGGIPWWSEFVWAQSLRRAKFIHRAADLLDSNLSAGQHRQRILEEIERRVSGDGYIAQTAHPSYADLALFAQLACASDIGLEGQLNAHTSPALTAYCLQLATALPDHPTPPLITGRRPFRLSVS